MRKLKSRQKGQGLVEYALILVLVAVVVLVVLALLGDQVNMIFARITLELQYPGEFGGDPVSVSGMTLSIVPGPAGTSASANVGLSGATGTPNICVQFTDSQNGSKTSCDPNPRVNFPAGGSGTVTACVIGVQGHSLVGGPYCETRSY
ncbi:MAG: hypothetical protein ACLFU8_07315 [Anaerolineales bacterium]